MENFNFRLSIHLQDKAKEMKIPLSRIMDVLESPSEVVPSTIHPGQDRYIKNGLAVMVCNGVAITFYLDRVITPLRPDQIAKGVKINRRY